MIMRLPEFFSFLLLLLLVGTCDGTSTSERTTFIRVSADVTTVSRPVVSFDQRLSFVHTTRDVPRRWSSNSKAATRMTPHQRPALLPLPLPILRYSNQNVEDTTTSTASKASTTSISTSATVVTTIAETSLTGVIVNVTFSKHRPLGCIIEESLVTNAGRHHIVFLTAITSNGHAEQAGLLVGDVIMGVSAAFTTTTTSNDTCGDASSSTTMIDVTGFGIDRVKSLIMCRHDNEPFKLSVLRGSTALSDHEVALTELCSNPDATSNEAEQCMIDYIQGGYAITNQNTAGSKLVNVDVPNDGECLLDTDEEGECLLNDMHSLWASDLPTSSSQQQNTSKSSRNQQGGDVTAAVKPWSSRASPSGTFVRDPTTGKMKNLDSTN